MPMSKWVMLAEIDTSVPSLLLQGGAFALLSYIVTVMTPRVLANSTAEREARDGRFVEAIKELNQGFSERQKEIARSAVTQAEILATAVKTQSETLANEVKVQNDLIVAALKSVCKTGATT